MRIPDGTRTAYTYYRILQVRWYRYVEYGTATPTVQYSSTVPVLGISGTVGVLGDNLILSCFHPSVLWESWEARGACVTTATDRARARAWSRLQQMMVLPRYTAFPSLLGQPRAPDLLRSRPSAAALSHGAVVAQWQPVVLTTSLHQSSSSPPRYCRPAAGAPQRCFSAVVSPQVVTGVAGLAEKLSPAAVEPMANSGMCGCEVFGQKVHGNALKTVSQPPTD